ncbi:MAG: hypothetical protein IKA74_03590 [Clostridia bacterium]|nr:hypothetical protein [Clostridia bacterium]
MKYIVGYQDRGDTSFLDTVIKNQDSIKELYFSWGDFPNGRKSLFDDASETLFERQMRQAKDLKRLSEEKIPMNLLFNANCYGEDSQSRKFFEKIGSTVDFIKQSFGLSSVTTSSPLIAKFIKNNFEGVDVRASVNMEIGSVEGLGYVKDCFDSYYIKREKNRSFAELARLRKWCDSEGKEMYLLANSGCLYNCLAHIFHDNLVAHEADISKMDNGYDFSGVCWEFLKNPDNRNEWLERTTFIRPEDIHLYEGLVSAVKLATRVNFSPSRIIDAYVKRRYHGSVMELLEPNHSGVFYPQYVDNSKIPDSFAKRAGSCDRNCRECGYCSRVMNGATVTLSADTSLKV